MAIQIGDIVRASAVFQNESSVDADPTTITMKYKNPAGDITTLVRGTDNELEKDSTGNYHVDITIDQSGFWYHQWIGTGAVAAGDEEKFEVEVTQFE